MSQNSDSEHRALFYGIYTARKYTFNDLKLLERELLRYCKCDGKVIFTRLFLVLGNVTFDGDVSALKRYWKGDISYTFIKP